MYPYPFRNFTSEGVAEEFQEAVEVEVVVGNFSVQVNKAGSGCNHSLLDRILEHDDLWHTCIGCNPYHNAAD